MSLLTIIMCCAEPIFLFLLVKYFHTGQHLIMLHSSSLSSSQPFLKKLVEKKNDNLNGLKVPCLRNKWNYALRYGFAEDRILELVGDDQLYHAS